MQRRFLWLTAGLLAIGLAAPRPCVVDEPPPEPIDCPLCAGNAKLHAAMLRFLADRALDQIGSALTQPFTRA
jgi:hypothetical protein